MGPHIRIVCQVAWIPHHAAIGCAKTERSGEESLRNRRRVLDSREPSQLHGARVQFQRQVRARIQETLADTNTAEELGPTRGVGELGDAEADAESMQRTQVQGGGSQDDRDGDGDRSEPEPATRTRNLHTIQRIAHSTMSEMPNVEEHDSSSSSFHDDFPLLARLSDGSIRYLPRQTPLFFGDCARQDSSITASIATASTNTTVTTLPHCHCYVCTLLRPIN